MTHKLNPQLSKVRSENTKPELFVRGLLHRLGYRFRLHRQELPGTPDIVFPSKQKVIYVHGCFWHRHSCDKGRKMPASNVEYWSRKFRRNIQRDLRNQDELLAMGWEYMLIWECELAEISLVQERIYRFLGKDADDD